MLNEATKRCKASKRIPCLMWSYTCYSVKIRLRAEVLIIKDMIAYVVYTVLLITYDIILLFILISTVPHDDLRTYVY